jgi:hypothetical protein
LAQKSGKKMLANGIVDGTYPDFMDPEAVYGDKHEFRQYKWINFKSNLSNLRAAIKRDIHRANADAANVAIDLQLYSPAPLAAQGYPVWAESAAERQLKIDVDNGRHLTMKPKELYGLDDRPEYRAWPLKVFRKHIHQEVRSRKTQAYWLHRAPGASASEPWPSIDSL